MKEAILFRFLAVVRYPHTLNEPRKMNGARADC